MTVNPYQAPQAPVQDLPESRPKQVTTAVRLMWISLVAGMFYVFLRPMTAEEQEALAGIIVMAVIFFALFGLLYYLVWTGRNWARWLWLILSVAGWIWVFVDWETSFVTPIDYIVQPILLILDGVIAWLLLSGPANAWFKRA